MISFLLTIVLIVSTPLAAYAEGSAGGIPVSPGNSGGGSNPTIPDSWGIKVSIGSVNPMLEEGITPVDVAVDPSTLQQQYNDIVAINTKRMWDPAYNALAADRESYFKTFTSAHTYYKCVAGQFIPITEAEAVSLGYVFAN